jgi:hypothetical protein
MPYRLRHTSIKGNPPAIPNRPAGFFFVPNSFLVHPVVHERKTACINPRKLPQTTGCSLKNGNFLPRKRDFHTPKSLKSAFQKFFFKKNRAGGIFWHPI